MALIQRDMSKYGSLFIAATFLISCREISVKEFSYPPEWEKHQAVWIDFHDNRDWAVPDYEARFEIIQALQNRVPVKALVDSEAAAKLLDSLMQSSDLGASGVTIISHLEPNIAMRDAGPIFLSNQQELMIADFYWNGYGGKHAQDLGRGDIPNDLASRFGWKVKSSEFAAEGGGIEVNSNTMVSFKHHGLSRNKGKSLNEIEKAYLDMYNKEKIIWIEHPLILETPGKKIENYFGQGADQHIDAYMRFVNDSTLLVPVIDESERLNSPIQEKDFEAIQKNLEQLRNETDANGSPFTIVEIPMPDISLYTFKTIASEYLTYGFPEMTEGEEVVIVPIMGYSNFLITNDVVLVSEYWREGLPEKEKRKDEEMKTILSKFFPNREIIGIKNAIQLNWNGGGIHCQTQQEPFILKSE